MYSLLLAIIYLAFISLGLPDSLLGSAWPIAHVELGVPLSSSGLIFMLISAGTVVSSLNSDRLTRKLGTGLVTALSVCLTAAALLGFSFSHSYLALCLWAIPYGLGAGSVDAALNNYVALHYASRHMSWLHCMWGLGTSIGPLIMGAVLTRGLAWNMGYRVIGLIQVLFTLCLFASLRLWKRPETASAEGEPERPLRLSEIVAIPGVKAVMLCFFCYCALEQTALLWACSYLVKARAVDEITAAKLGSLFCIGITGGRGLSGFITYKLNDRQMFRLGIVVLGFGILLMLLPFGRVFACAGLVVVGLGCAPIYPSVIHATPANFGASRSQAIIGVQMASAYVGTTLMPPFFGLLASRLGLGLGVFPLYLLALLALMAYMHEKLCKTVDAAHR